MPSGANALSSVDHGRILQLHLDGKSYRDIGSRYKVSASVIHCLIQKYNATGSMDRHHGQGRKRKTTAREDTRIVREVKRNRFSSANDIREALNMHHISEGTIRNRIREVESFASYWAIKKPKITERNRLIRLNWAKEHRNWTPEQWEKVLWSDESPYALHYCGRRRVWRRPNERFLQECTIPTVKQEKRINVWGCFAAHGVGRLYMVKGIMVKEDYHRILIHQMRPSAGVLFPDGDFIFQEDNDPKHSSKLCRGYLERVGVNRMTWPSQSPDLNPIESLWSILDNKVKDRQPSTQEELFAVLQEGWNGLDRALLTRLVQSMQRRCVAVIAARGNCTKY